MKRSGRVITILAAVALLLGAGGCTITTEGVQEAEVPLEEVFPPSKAIASYRQLHKPEKISDDELEAQLGGQQRLGQLRKWGTLSTLATDYGIPERPPKARVSVTEMGSRQNAYGAYTNVRPGLLNEANYIKIGVHATVDGERLIFVQDRFVIVVRDLSGEQDPARRTMLINFARGISDRIPRDITDINLVGYLPYENRVPATERLDKEDPLNLGIFRAGGVTALYRIDDREGKVFLGEVVDTSSAKGLLRDVRKAMEKEGPLGELELGDEGAAGKLFEKTAMAARRGTVVFGCYGTLTDKEIRNILAGIDRQIKPPLPQIKTRKKEEPEEKKTLY